MQVLNNCLRNYFNNQLRCHVGNSGTVVSAVNEGYIDNKTITRSCIGGRVMDNYLLNLITKNKLHNKKPIPLYQISKRIDLSQSAGNSASSIISSSLISNDIQYTLQQYPFTVHPTFQSYSMLELARDMRESHMRIADVSLSSDMTEFNKYNNLPLTSYELPDGTMVDLGIERYQVSELLFESNVVNLHEMVDCQTLFDSSYPAGASESELSARKIFPERNESFQQSLQTLVLDSYLRADTESQSSLLSNIIVTGGNASYDNFLERVRYEVERVVYTKLPGVKVFHYRQMLLMFDSDDFYLTR